MTITELKKFTDFARKNGILKLKVNGLELEFSPEALFPSKEKQQVGEVQILEVPKESFSEEQIAEAESLGLTPEEAKVVLWSSSQGAA